MNLKTLRNEIDRIDKEFIKLLTRRFLLVEKIGRKKRSEGKSIIDQKREKTVFSKLNKKENQVSLENVFKEILKQSRKIQKKRL